jgi:hypothetical protein
VTDFLVYHNPDRMGFPASEVDVLSIVTNRSASGAKGARVWLVTGDGQPRAFSLRGYFVVDEVAKSTHPDFKIEVSGTAGELFDPMPRLDGEDWFPEFKRSQGNFAFGFQPIKDLRFVKGLQRVAERIKK